MIDIHTHHKNAIGAIINLYDNYAEIVPGKKYSVGIHPWYIDNWEQKWQQLEYMADNPCVVAIGECGLDKWVKTDWAIQNEVFKMQIQLANKLQKPLIIHCVKSWSECIHLLKNARVPVIFHGFNQSIAIASKIIENGYYISFGKSIFKENIQSVIRQVPINHIFLETDDSLFPIEEIYKTTAEALNIQLNALILQIQKNVKQVWGKDIFYDE